MFYPLTPLFILMDVFRALGVFVVCHYFLAGVFALFLARGVFQTRQAAVIFALLYAFNGWAITRAAHQPAIEYMFAYTWLPLAALAIEKAIKGESRLVACVTAGAAVAWTGIACPNLFVYGMLLLATAFVLRMVYLLYVTRTNAFAVAVTVVVAALAFAFALGALEYLPASELAGFTKTGRLGASLPGGWRGQPLGFLTMLKMYFPYTPGRPFAVYYSPGMLAVAAALYGLYSLRRNKSHRVAAAGAIVVLVFGMALLAKTALFTTLARASDTFARASLIPAGLILLVLPVAFLAALGVDALCRDRRWVLGRRPILVVALVFTELFVGFGIVYPAMGERKLTFDYRKEIADFPHLDTIAAAGDAGRMLVVSPPEGDIIAPSYAVLSRGLSRLNLSLSDFAPDWVVQAIDEAALDYNPTTLAALSVGYVASTRELPSLGRERVVLWKDVYSHYADNVHFPLRNEPGWLAWDSFVHLYRIADIVSPVRAAPLSRKAILTGRSETPLDEIKSAPLSEYESWTPMTVLGQTANSIIVPLPESAPTRYFFAVTAYPGWHFYADGRKVPHVTTAGAFMAVDVPEGSALLLARFEPTHKNLGLALAACAVVFAVLAVGREISPKRRRALPSL